MQADLVIRNATVATLQGPPGPRSLDQAENIGLREHYCIAIRDGVIAWLGPDQEWDGEATNSVAAEGKLVTPGYVDSHTHIVYAGDRSFELEARLQGKSYLDILADGGGIAYTSRLTREATVEELVAQTVPRIADMQASGTAAIESKSGYALDVDGELRMLAANPILEQLTGMKIVSTFCGAHAVPPEYQQNVDGYVDLVVGPMLDRVIGQGIATYIDVFVEEGVFTREQGKRIMEAGAKRGMRGRLHADEIVNTGGAQLAAETRCLTADHLLQADDDGLAKMADAGVIAVLLPTVPITLGTPVWPRAEKLRAAGVAVALASDHNPNNPIRDMAMVGQMASHGIGLTPNQALTGVTWNGAASLDLTDDYGSIEIGKPANLVMHCVDTVAKWVQTPGRRTAEIVVNRGQIIG